MDAIDPPPPGRSPLAWKRYVAGLVAGGLAVLAMAMGWLSSVPVVFAGFVVAVWAIHGLVAGGLRHFVSERARACLSAAIGCLLVLLLTITPHAGFVLILVAIPLAIWFAWSIVAVLRDRALLRVKAIPAAMWIATFLIVAGVHWYYVGDARRAGDAYVHAIERYKAEHGAYPPDMKAAGLTDARNRYMLRYSLDDATPHLTYAATFAMFDAYDYDFAKHAWVYVPD